MFLLDRVSLHKMAFMSAVCVYVFWGELSCLVWEEEEGGRGGGGGGGGAE